MSIFGAPAQQGPSALFGVMGFAFEEFNQPPLGPPVGELLPPNNNTKVPFTPSSTSPFQFQAILDNNPYLVVIAWNLFGRRYYVNISTAQGIRILTIPMIASPLNYDISLTAGYFTSELIWRIDMNWFEVSPDGTGDGSTFSPNVTAVIAAAQATA